ncbi:hypothetical protein QWY16_02205 [Planococcus shenhongbingii]|uniref:hypothetical protein n=1 Tax=Planococcus shenhongbingii TaxID=3058398 RepID=UPI0026324FF4|nr:hypothetical protein [Planococcus sp. N016]WKA58994.1 hypothetical protein QWY16_02205 [Planococcus sp. N016]
MISTEEKRVFEYELNKLSREYQNCANDSLKSQIKEDISFLQSVLQSFQQKSVKMNIFNQ